MTELPTIFPSFNARSSQPWEVATTFVPSESFSQLCGQRHSVVLGPRGSGKTTLLKMLQAPALESWQHPAAEEVIQQISFIGVFIPFDRSWQAQFEALGAHLSEPAGQAISRAAFTAHVLRSLLYSFANRASNETSKRRVKPLSLSSTVEQELCDNLYELWLLRSGPRSLKGIRLALSNRLVEIGRLAGRLNFLPFDQQAQQIVNAEYLHLNFIDAVTSALDAWESATSEPQQHWALLFDELELAPQSIKRELFQSIRSRDSRLLFKLALSPFDGDIHLGESPEDPQAGQDYDEIALWFPEKRASLTFCEALWRSLVSPQSEAIDPVKRLGHSRFDTPLSAWIESESQTAYRADSRKAKAFADLLSIDSSFRRYLESRRIDPEKLHTLTAASRAAEIRKIAPLVEARLFFLRESAEEDSTDEPERRSRKRRASLYTGWESLCAVTEGNPRLFIGTVRWILNRSMRTKGRIPRSIQADAIERATNRFRAMLRTVPVHDTVARFKNRGLLSLLDAVGAYFHEKQIGSDFTPEPPGSFVVDSSYGDEMLRAIGQSLNTGALIYVAASREENVLSSLRGKRFRLSYLLASHYGLIPRLGRPVSLGRILRDVHFAARDQITLELMEGQDDL